MPQTLASQIRVIALSASLLNRDGVLFVTVRRRGKRLVEQARAVPTLTFVNATGAPA